MTDDEPTCDSCGEPLNENGECPNLQTILDGVNELIGESK